MPYSLDNIHPLFIHFPIALLSTGLFFDLLAVILKREDLENAGFWCMLMGTISCLFSNFTGIMIFLTGASFSDLPRFTHALLAWSTTFIFAFLFWARIKYQMDFRYSPLKQWIYFSINILAVGILFYGAHLGAEAAGRIQ
ncbi:uncharacterized protein METZ01_LOCUS149981 [marine metagenome]|uniref:DUF2231 domain-containing protein n=1 Tax=marine metagenome TaxID=408172 RepID=A0A382A7V1_9ZZZZ